MTDAFVRVALCVNDVDSGKPTGHLCAAEFIAFGEVEPRLVLAGDLLQDDRNPTFAFLGTSPHLGIRIGCSFFAITSHVRWVGNWCWDEVTMPRVTACRLVAYLLTHHFSLELQGETDLLPPSRSRLSLSR